MTDKSPIPNNQSCLDCVHFNKTCKWLLSREGSERECDWFPSKFKPFEVIKS